MKITIDIDCTPDEARRFLGLPEVAPMQEALMGQLQERMESAMSAMDAETLLKTWMPTGMPEGMKSWEALQKMFWSQMGMGGGESGGTRKGGSGKSGADE